MKTFFIIILLLYSFAIQAGEVFKNGQATVGRVKIKIEIADHDKAWAQGLMFRKSLASDQGMLFVFPGPKIQSFWMKNTLIPLSIGFFDAHKKLIDIQDMAPVVSELQVALPSYVSKAPAQYALEVNQGWFAKNKVKIGDSLDFHPK